MGSGMTSSRGPVVRFLGECFAHLAPRPAAAGRGLGVGPHALDAPKLFDLSRRKASASCAAQSSPPAATAPTPKKQQDRRHRGIRATFAKPWLFAIIDDDEIARRVISSESGEIVPIAVVEVDAVSHQSLDVAGDEEFRPDACAK